MKLYPHYIIDVARELRKNQTPAESLLWERLRNRRSNGLKFRRQHHIGRYIVDFYCAELRLVIELEGGIRQTPDQKEYDENRFDFLEANDMNILRLKTKKC
jgi:very-short-patch-repair endonuclease